MDRETFFLFIQAWILFGVAIFIILLFVTAPYGRHSSKDWGPVIPNRTGWFVMEFPALLVFALFFLLGPSTPHPVTWIFFALFTIHYAYRSVIYPWRTHTSGKTMPLVVALMAVFFNLVNGFINGYYFSAFSRGYSWEWLLDARFAVGLVLFIGGAGINWWSDQILLNLRKERDGGYFIPRGGLFRWVSCPNFFGEILEWTGFAVMTWSPAALAFALWTIFNLVPRALDHHRWYHSEFPEYPPGRKAVIPFIL